MTVLSRTLCCLLVSATVSCSAARPAAARRLQLAPMPVGERWNGLYQGPYHIVLNIWTTGARARGNWRAVGDREGVFSGKTSGNLLTLDWTERAVGHAETWSGHGYFVYALGEPGAPAQIFGEWGMDGGRGTSSWWALKRASDPLGNVAGQLDKDAEQQDQDDGSACEMGACDSTDTDLQ